MKNTIKIIAAIIFALAISLHRSAAAFAVAFVILGILKIIPENFRKIIIFVAIFIPIVYFLSPELYQLVFYMLRINYYIPTDRINAGELFILYYLIFIFAILFSNKNIVSEYFNSFFKKLGNKLKIKENTYKDDECNALSDYTTLLMCVFGVGVSIESFSSVCNTMLRFSSAFLLAVIVVVPNVISINKSKLLRLVAQIGIIAVLAIAFYLDYYRTNYLHGFPYAFFN